MTELIHPLAKFGMIGFGAHAKNLFGSFSRTANARITHIGARHPEKTAFVRRKFPDVIVETDYDQVLQSAEIDAVLIALPNHLHAEWIERTLAAGKHVLCEKPLCLDSTTARRLAEKAKAQELLLAEAFYYREHHQHKIVKELLSGGEIGEIQKIEARYHYFLEEQSNFRLQSGHGAGILFDAGCYGVDSARFYFDSEPEEVCGTLWLDREGIDRRAEFALTFGESKIAHVSCRMDGERESSLKIYGTKGMICIPNAFHVQATQKVSVAVHRNNLPDSINPQPVGDQFALFIDRFAEALVTKTQLPAPLEDGEKNTIILERIRRESNHVSLRSEE